MYDAVINQRNWHSLFCLNQENSVVTSKEWDSDANEGNQDDVQAPIQEASDEAIRDPSLDQLVLNHIIHWHCIYLHGSITTAYIATWHIALLLDAQLPVVHGRMIIKKKLPLLGWTKLLRMWAWVLRPDLAP